MDHHFTFDSAHGSATDANHWNAGGSGTYHGNQADVHFGGNVVNNGGHFGGGVSGGVTGHVTPNVDIGVGGHASTGGNYGGMVSGTVRW